MYGTLTLSWNPGCRTAVPETRGHAPIDITTQRVASGTTLVRVCGEVDLLTAPVLRTELDYQLDLPPSVLVVDLTDVTSLGVAGLEVLVEARERACRTATPVRLVYQGRGRWRSCTLATCSRPTGNSPTPSPHE